MLLDGMEVNHKVLSAVGEKVRGYRYSLRCKYVKEDTTKEALYHLDISKHRSNISDQMWVGLVDHFFSDKFQNGHFEEDNTLNSSMYGGGKKNVQMHEQRDIEVIMNDIGSSKDVNNNTVESPSWAQHVFQKSDGKGTCYGADQTGKFHGFG